MELIAIRKLSNEEMKNHTKPFAVWFEIKLQLKEPAKDGGSQEVLVDLIMDTDGTIFTEIN